MKNEMVDPGAFGRIINAVSAVSGRRITHATRMVTLLRAFASQGRTLESLTGPRYFNRTLNTLKRYARKGEVRFPDYTPRPIRKRKAASVTRRAG